MAQERRKFKSKDSLRRHNSEGRWKCYNLFKEQNGRNPDKNEVRDLHKKVTHGHQISIDAVVGETNIVLSLSEPTFVDYDLPVMRDKHGSVLTYGQVVDSVVDIINDTTENPDEAQAEVRNFTTYVRNGGRIRIRSGFYSGSNDMNFTIMPEMVNYLKKQYG